MFGYDNVHTEVVTISEPAADGTLVIWRAPARHTSVEVLEAWAACDTEIAGAGTQVALTLVDRGPAGTATPSTVAPTVGTASTGDWTANTPREFTLTEGTLDGGDYLCLVYDETGTAAPKNITVGFSWVSGVGA